MAVKKSFTILLIIMLCGCVSVGKNKAQSDGVLTSTYFSTQRDKLLSVVEEMGEYDLHLAEREGRFSLNFIDSDNLRSYLVISTSEMMHNVELNPNYFSLKWTIEGDEDNTAVSMIDKELVVELFNTWAKKKTSVEQITNFFNDQTYEVETSEIDFTSGMVDYYGSDDVRVSLFLKKGVYGTTENVFRLQKMSNGFISFQIDGLKSKNSGNCLKQIELLDSTLKRVNQKDFTFDFYDSYYFNLLNNDKVTVSFSTPQGQKDIEVDDKNCKLIINYDTMHHKKANDKTGIDIDSYINLVNSIGQYPINLALVEKAIDNPADLMQVYQDRVFLVYDTYKEPFSELMSYQSLAIEGK